MTRALTLVAALILALLTQPALARDISGDLTYRARIALPPEAELVVELRGPSGPLAETRQPTGGRQVPLPFTLTTGDSGDVRLRAAIFAGGRALWLSDTIAIPAGTGPVALGPVELWPHPPFPATTRLRCGREEVDLIPQDGSLRLRVAGRSLDLIPLPAASGTRHGEGASPGTSVWSRGNRALLRLDGTLLPECQPMIPDALLPLTARGNEPFWSLRITREGLTLTLPEGKGTIETAPYAPPEVAGDTLIFTAPGFELLLQDGPCRDSMTGMPHPFRATLRRGTADWPGCAGDPSRLLQGDWRVFRLGPAPLPDAAEVTLAFSDTRLSGKAACNRFAGDVRLGGEGLTLGPLAATRMACAPALMQVEAATLAALARVAAFDLDPDGSLLLLDRGGSPLLAARR